MTDERADTKESPVGGQTDALRSDETPKYRCQRPDVPAPLIVWEYAFSLERIVEDLQARLKEANGHA